MKIEIISLEAAEDICPNFRQQLDEIFFQSSATQHFNSLAERAAFAERWLGRYLLADATHGFVAMSAGVVAGYVIGTVEDMFRLPRFADLGTVRSFAVASRDHPAHLHINVAASMRSAGVGSRLIEKFAAHAQAAGAPGMHVVTSAASRNVRFYARCGFREIARIASPRGDTVFLGRAFRDAPPAVIK